MKLNISSRIFILLLAGFILQTNVFAQFDVGGEFRLRWYRDAYSQALDNRGTAEYTRMLAHINTSYKASDLVHLNVELMNLNNDLLPLQGHLHP